jgi:hypothetical protein
VATRPADDQTFHDDIEGYCGRLSYAHGESVTVHVSTRSARYDVRVERWGANRELVWETTGVVGEYLAPPDDADANGCGWPSGVEFAVDETWRSGFHLVTLTAHGAPVGRNVAHAGFVVRGNPADPARALHVLDTNTWHAYNTWGGRSLYTGGHRVSHARPFGRGILVREEVDRDDRKARPVRWGEEPDVDGTIFQRYRTDNAYPSAIGSRATPRGVGGFVVYRDDHWMLEGTGLGYGDVLGVDDGIVGYETVGCPLTFDDLQQPVARPHPGVPADIEIVAFTPSSNLMVGEYPASISALSDQGDAEFIATRLYGDAGDANLARVRHGNAVMLTCRPFGPDGGEVVTVGTTDWVFGLRAARVVMWTRGPSRHRATSSRSATAT